MEIIQPSLIDTLTIAGRTFTDLANLTTLIATTAGAAANNHATFRKPAAAAGYQVPVGKSFKIKALKVYSAVGAANGALTQILYCDNDVGLATNTAFTNGVYPAGASTLAIGTTVQVAEPGSAMWQSDFDFVVPASKYLSMSSFVDNVYCLVYGYEV